MRTAGLMFARLSLCRSWSSMGWWGFISRTEWLGILPPSASECPAQPPHRTWSRRWPKNSGLTWECYPHPSIPFMRCTSAGVSSAVARRVKSQNITQSLMWKADAPRCFRSHGPSSRCSPPPFFLFFTIYLTQCLRVGEQCCTWHK